MIALTLWLQVRKVQSVTVSLPVREKVAIGLVKMTSSGVDVLWDVIVKGMSFLPITKMIKINKNAAFKFLR